MRQFVTGMPKYKRFGATRNVREAQNSLTILPKCALRLPREALIGGPYQAPHAWDTQWWGWGAVIVTYEKKPSKMNVLVPPTRATSQIDR